MMSKTMLGVCVVALGLALAGCHNAAKSNMERIDDLKKQVTADAKTLQDLEAKEYTSLKKDFMACDSMLQYYDQEQVDQAFEKLRLVQAYLEQFKVTKPVILADMDSTLVQLDLLKADAESQYLSDSLVTVYIANETEYVNKLSNQVQYFQDRLGKCRKDLNALKQK